MTSPQQQLLLDEGLYRYDPIAIGNIRILHLATGSDSEPLRCWLEHVSPSSDDTQYEAISYVWGNDLELLNCTTGHILVPRNLCEALRQLRFKSVERILWADAVCINQTDSREKGLQVASMGTVFSHASQVIMWQGPSDPVTASRALKALERFCEIAESPPDSELRGLLTRSVSRILRQRNILRPAPITPEQLQALDLSGIDWSAFDSLLSQPYFSRLWIVQEIALAQNATILFGDQQLAWRKVKRVPVANLYEVTMSAADIFVFLSDQYELVRSNIYNMIQRPLMSASCLRTSGPSCLGLTLLDLLLETKETQCADARDCLYALYGIVPELREAINKHPNLVPDYALTPESVFHRAAIWFLVEQKAIEYLLLASISHLELGEPGPIERRGRVQHLDNAVLPTWVAILDIHQEKRRLRPLRDLNYNLYHVWFQNVARYESSYSMLAAGGFGSNETLAFLSEDSTLLTMNGKMADRVEQLAPRPPRSPGKVDVEAVMEIYEGAETLVLKKLTTPELYILIAADYLGHTLGPLLGAGWKSRIRSKDFMQILCLISIGGDRAENPDSHRALVAGFLDFIEPLFAGKWPGSDYFVSVPREFGKYAVAIIKFGMYHRFFLSSRGTIGLTSGPVLSDDVIAVISGLALPLTLRPADDDSYAIVGLCVLGDMTYGAALTMDDIPMQKIVLR